MSVALLIALLTSSIRPDRGELVGGQHDANMAMIHVRESADRTAKETDQTGAIQI